MFLFYHDNVQICSLESNERRAFNSLESHESLPGGGFYYDQGKILKIGKGGVRGSTEISMIMPILITKRVVFYKRT